VVSAGEESAYRASGVDIDAQDRALERVKELLRSTATPGVLSELGSFGGLFELPAGLDRPVLVASADGVGTKLMVARLAGDFSTVGRDLVNHCVNDVLVQGARPLFFLDYVGAGALDPEHVVQRVAGVAGGCRENGCALLGGETAEMPGFYRPGDYELVGFIVGVAEREALLGPERVAAGDVLLGLPSSGLHTNGYSLARKILFEEVGAALGDPLPLPAEALPMTGEGRPTVGEALLAVHRTYYPLLSGLLAHPGLHAMAHITGGGLTDNLPRALPPDTHAVVERDSWQVPELFRVLQQRGGVGVQEMARVFNMGVGMVLVVAAEAAGELLARLAARGEPAWRLGEVASGAGRVRYR
jgi:phosphoribosylformylglycinamidine cyclo-ligase